MSDYLKEAKELEARWAANGLLKDIHDSYNRSSVAVLLENQRLMNEKPVDTEDIGQFKRLSIPLVRRLYPQMCNHPIQSPIVDLNDPNLKIWGTDERTVRKPKKVLRSLDDDWDA